MSSDLHLAQRLAMELSNERVKLQQERAAHLKTLASLREERERNAELRRELAESEEARDELVRSHARLFPYPATVKRVASVGLVSKRVAVHLFPVLPLGGRE